MFNKEKRQEKKAERKAVKEKLDKVIKPRPTFAQRQEKEALRDERAAENLKIQGAVAERLQSLHKGEGTTNVAQLGATLLYVDSLSDIRLQIKDQLTDRTKVFSRWTVYARHDKDFLGMAPTNREVEFGGMSITFLDGDDVTQELHYWDMVSLLQQIQAP